MSFSQAWTPYLRNARQYVSCLSLLTACHLNLANVIPLANYPLIVTNPAYAKVSGLPTICAGGDQDAEYPQDCYSFTPGGWVNAGSLSKGMRYSASVEFGDDKMLMAGTE